MEIPQTYRVSVIIPNYNGKSLLGQYLPYVFRAFAACNAITESEIIVVDDASTDGSAEYLTKEWSEIHLLQNEQNSGFGKSVNKGIAAARYEIVCILNTDMQLSEDYFSVLLPFFDKEQVFGAYCAIRDPRTGEITEGRKQVRIHHNKLSYIDLCGEQEEGESMYLCGGNALVWRDKLLALGGYDELFCPFYFEDMDLSLRAKAKGWVSLYTTRTSCLHQHAATIGNQFSHEKVQEIFLRNRVYINYRYLHGWSWGVFMVHACWHAATELICFRPSRPYSKALRQILAGKLAGSRIRVDL